MPGEIKLQPNEAKAVLLRQFEVAWQLMDWHLRDLTDEECLWRPAGCGLHVHQQESRWIADWPDREDYGLGPSSIGWISWHIGFWWSMALDHNFGEAKLVREEVFWPGSAAATADSIRDLRGRWSAAVDGVSAEKLFEVGMARWPFSDRTFADLLAWVNIELMKNAAELGYVRFLYAAKES